MKKLRRFVALLMAMIMVMGTCMTTQAATNDGSIKITNATVDEEYSIYKILDLSYNANTKSYYYTVASGWENFFATGGAGASYVDIDSVTKEVTWSNSGTAANLAKLALAYAQDTSNSISAVDTKTASSTTLTFENLEYGYYLVDSSLGSLCSLSSTDPQAEVADKNGTPTVDKEVQEDSTTEYGDTNTADIGDTVYFRSKIENAANASNLVLHDKMSAGLTLDPNSFVITAGGLTASALVADSNYTITVYTTTPTDECTFEIAFTDDFTATPTASEIIFVTYTAKVNEDAVIRSTGNPNETYVTYGNSGESTHDETITYVYDLYVYKYDKDTSVPLEGAKFVLYKLVSGTKYYAVLDAENKISGWTTLLTSNDPSDEVATVLESGADGLISVIGLDADDYYLEETEAPAGYTPLSDPVAFTINEAGKLIKDSQEVTDTMTIKYESRSVIKVANGSGNEMPSTGGIGTTIFYVVGSIMVLGAAVLLITRRRMHES